MNCHAGTQSPTPHTSQPAYLYRRYANNPHDNAKKMNKRHRVVQCQNLTCSTIVDVSSCIWWINRWLYSSQSKQIHAYITRRHHHHTSYIVLYLMLRRNILYIPNMQNCVSYIWIFGKKFQKKSTHRAHPTKKNKIIIIKTMCLGCLYNVYIRNIHRFGIYKIMSRVWTVCGMRRAYYYYV